MDGDHLYGLALDRFVPERTALARQLRADGRRDAAAEVAALRKPSVAAWAVNQLVRTQEPAVDELWHAGDALRQAQGEVVAGRSPANALRLAMEQERAAADDLTGKATGLLTSAGHELSATMIERVTETLHAAALDEEARALVRQGRLVRELRHIGLGMGGGGAFGSREATTAEPPPRTGGSRTPAKTAAKPRRGADRAREPQAAEREAERRRADHRKAARAREVQARHESERAEKALRAAESRHARAAQALDEADAALACARTAADDAAAVHRQAQAALSAL